MKLKLKSYLQINILNMAAISLAVSAIVIGIVIVVNLILNQLPADVRISGYVIDEYL